MQWSNWAKNIVFTPQHYRAPTTLEELRHLVTHARRVRVAGAGHSFNAAVQTQDTLVSLKNLKKVLLIDRTKKTIKVEGGITLKEMNAILHTNKLCIPNPGNLETQTIAGLICNASHGSSLNYGTINENILEIELITAHGNLLKINPSNAQHFRAACCSLGVLGVVYSVTFQCEDIFHLRKKERIAPLQEALAFAQSYQGFSLELWFLPYTQHAVVVTMEKILRSSKFAAFKKKLNDFIFGNLFFMALLFWLKGRPWQIPQTMNRLAKNYKAASSEGWADTMLYSLRLFRAYSIELCFPRQNLPQALAVLQTCLEDHFTVKGNTFFLSLPVHIRFTKADEKGLLSPAAQRDCAYVEVLSARRFKGYESFFRDFETRTKHLMARPHWGKLFYGNPLEHYPPENIAAFEKTRATLDPSGKFLNAHFQFFENHRKTAEEKPTDHTPTPPSSIPELQLQTELSEPSPEVNF